MAKRRNQPRDPFWKGLKKAVRARFKAAVFERDNYTCQVCGAVKDPQELNAHHITDRSLMPFGGYVAENGITVCEDPCHRRVEQFHETGTAEPGLAPSDLYRMIGSTYEDALKACDRPKEGER